MRLMFILAAASVMVGCETTRVAPRSSLDFGGVAAVGKTIEGSASRAAQITRRIPRSNETSALTAEIETIRQQAKLLDAEVKALRSKDAKNAVNEEDNLRKAAILEEKARRANKAIWSRNLIIVGLLAFIFRDQILGIIKFLWSMIFRMIRPI